MDQSIKVYNLHDSGQKIDDLEYWKGKTPREKLHALEVIRASGSKLNQTRDGKEQRLRRVLRITQQK